MLYWVAVTCLFKEFFCYSKEYLDKLCGSKLNGHKIMYLLFPDDLDIFSHSEKLLENVFCYGSDFFNQAQMY